jgi:hypothetical protein
MHTTLFRVVPVVAATAVAVAMTAAPVAAASSSPRTGEGTAGRSGVSRPSAVRPVLQLQPGEHLTSGLKSTGFVGYAVTPTNLISAEATIKIPSIKCAPSGDSGIGPGVYLTGPNSGQDAAGGALYCENGQVTYDAGIEINGHETTVFTVTPGNTLVVSVSETTNKTSATVHDVTTGLSKTLSGAGNNKTQALVGDGGVYFDGIEGPVASVPTFTSYPISSVSVGGQALGSVHPVSVERVNGTTVELVPTAITGGNAFKVLFKHT